MRNVDTSSTIEVKASPIWPQVGMVFFGAFFLFLSYIFVQYLGRFLGFGRVFEGALFMALSTGALALSFGALTYVLWREARQGFRPVVFLSPEGYRDIRRAPDIIPWSEIRQVQAFGGRQVLFYLSKPMTDKLLGKPGFWRNFVAFNYMSPEPVLVTFTNTLQMDALTLGRIANEYWRAHGTRQAE